MIIAMKTYYFPMQPKPIFVMETGPASARLKLTCANMYSETSLKRNLDIT